MEPIKYLAYKIEATIFKIIPVALNLKLALVFRGEVDYYNL